MSWQDFLLVWFVIFLFVGSLFAAWWLLKTCWQAINGVVRFVLRRLPSLLRFHQGFRRSRNAWHKVILPQETKEELQIIQSILRHPKGYKKRWGQDPPLGLILHGPPGTGKTLAA